MRIVVDDLSGRRTVEFLRAHVGQLRAISPPESTHTLDLDGLRRPEVTVWSAWDGETIVGCGALRRLDETHAEIKSMRTAPARKRSGVASRLLEHIVDAAREAGCNRLSLETGSAEFFAPARALYRKFGFADCEPFGDYREDPNSVFMTRHLHVPEVCPSPGGGAGHVTAG
ncbi:GNAT family N-acetyltransferase [Streptomyces sp. OF3]|uniref:GNAT family N-acetyltransferase n=1 Tax=Streptomyces alkaliterrae TaxID=2213162 RepID=A0A7W3WHE8_9ACTN|nr:GNAT family N-acetyltransferase [Streptomyces alkaliterrae]MBB1252437.1 GNAT family N-acetyltransferase [Streptomyces alkaliterrae]